MKLKKLIITFFLLPAAFGYAQTQSTQIIAHRGFWKTNGSASCIPMNDDTTTG